MTSHVLCRSGKAVASQYEHVANPVAMCSSE